MAKKVIKEMIAKAPNRRNFVRNLGIASAAVGVASIVDPSKADAQSAISDFDILNFALNLEYLEAEFYTVATTGKTIDQFGYAITGGSGTSGTTTGGALVPFSTTDLTVKRVAQELAADERTHVALIQNTIVALGGTYVNKPAINLNALGFGFTGQSDFLQLARIFEEIGVTAYGGAAPLLASKVVLGYAARILATEAEHVGTIRSLLSMYGVSAGAVVDALDIPTPSNTAPTGVQYFSTDANSITLVRTPAQVLSLAFAANGATSGGFFPAGINGNAALGTSATTATAVAYNEPQFYATPNPITLPTGSSYGQTTVYWNAPAPTQYIQVRVGSPSGPLFTTNFPSGNMMTNVWVNEGMVLYLQDISNGKALTANNTLATLILRTHS